MNEPDMMQFETEKTVEDGPKGSPKRPPTTPNAGDSHFSLQIRFFFSAASVS
jgi:hypothetical protein